MTFDEQLLLKQNDVSARKASAAANIAQAKRAFQSNLLGTAVADNDFTNELLSTVPSADTEMYLEAGDEVRGLQTPSPIVEQDGPISKHADGTYSVTTAEGKVIPGLNEFDAKTFAAYNQENFRAVREGAPTDFIDRKLHGIGQTTVDLGVQGASMFTGSTTLPQTVNSYNRFSGRVPITDADINQYRAITSADKELTPAQQLFQNSTKFQKLISLDKEAQKNRSQFEAVQQFGKNLKSKIPVNRKDQFAAKVAFDTIAKNEGNWAAAWYTVTNDLDTLLSQGIDSIPYMVAFTIGGPVAQTAILTTLAIGRGNQAVEEFRTKYDKEPTTDEVTRIKIWAAVGTVAEKYGDMAAVRAIPGRLSWIRRTQQATKQTIPSKILDLGVFRPTLALAGEGLSGAITAASEKMGEAGEITDEDTGDIVYDALAEAFGTPGGIAGMIGGKALYTAAKLPFKPSDIEQRLINLDAAIASKDEVLYGATSKSRDERGELEELAKALKDIKKSKNREVLIKDVTEELVKKAKEKAPETELTPLEEEQIAAQAETEVDRRIREAEAREEELITKLETPISEEETKTYKEELRQDKIKIQAEDKKRKEAKAEAKAKKKALKTPEGKQSRISEIEAEIAAIKSKPGFPDEQQIKELVAEKDELSDETTKEDTTHTPIEEDEFNAFIESLPSADVIANPDTDPDVLDKALESVAEVYKHKSLTQEQIDKVDPIVKQIGGLDPDYKEEPMGSLKGLLNADAKQLKTALRIAKEKDKKEGKDVTVNQDVVNAAIAAKSKLKELKAIKEPSDKNMQEVHEEVEGGMSTRWTGLNTYYNKIVEIITENRDIPKGDTLAEPQIINLENEMKTHVRNLEKKRTAFKEAYDKEAAPKGMVNVVYGKRDEEAEGRAMIYSQDTIPIEQYEEERGGKKKVYVNAIMTEEAVAIQENENYKFTSDVLIQKVGAEASYGNELLTVVTGYKDTSFSRDAAQQASRRQALAIKKKQAVSVKFKKKKVPIDIIRNIKDLKAKTGPFATWSDERIAAALKKEEERKAKAEGKTSTIVSTTEKLLIEANKKFDTFVEELKNKKTKVRDTDKIQALAQASSTNLTIALNIVAIVEDFQNDMAYLDGKGKGIHANSSRQKEKVFKNVDVPAFKKFIRANGGVAAYLNFIYQHEKSHIINQDGAKYPKKKDGTTDLMHEKAIAIERSANAYAFEKIGFKAYTEEKKPTPTIEYKDLNYTVVFPENATWDEAWETATITNKENKERYAKSAPNAGADRRAIIAKAFLQKGLAIEVTDRGTTYTYIISSKTIISPKSNNVVFEQPPTGHNGNRDRILHAAETKLKTTKVGKVGKPPTPGAKTLTKADIKILREYKWEPFDPGPDEVLAPLFSDAEIKRYIKDPSQIQKDIASLTPLASLKPDWEKRRLEKIKNDTLAVDIGKAIDKIDVLKSLSVMKKEEESLQTRMTKRIAQVIKEKAKYWLGKEQVKTKIATQFIGEGGKTSSTQIYRKIYEEETAPGFEKGLANTGRYTSDDVIFIASNGTVERNGKVTREGIPPVTDQNLDKKSPKFGDGKLNKSYKHIEAAMEAGATIVMDTRQHIIDTNSDYTASGKKRVFKNTGELALARYLAANGYAREGGSGIWKPKPKAAAPTVKLSEVKKGSFEIDILTKKGEHKKQKIEGQVIEANGVPIIGIGKREGENWTLTHIATGGHFAGTFKKKYQAVAAAKELAELAATDKVDYITADATTLTEEQRKAVRDTTNAIAKKIKKDPFYGKLDTELAKQEKELQKKLNALDKDSGITGSIGSPNKKAEERAKILKELADVQNELTKRKEAAEAKHIRSESEGPVSDETTEGSDETTGDAGKGPGDTSTSKQKKGKVGKTGRKTGTKSPKQIAEEKEKEKQLAEDEKSRSIPTKALSKQALHVLFPEIISPEGTLIDEADTKNAGLLAKLATQLDISGASIEEINAALKKLPDRKNFAEGALETFSPAVTEEQLDKSKTAAHKQHGGKTVVQRKAVNLENIFGILGRFITKLLNFKRNKELIDGIHTLPAAVFRGITDDTGRKQYKSLERALEALGASKETAVLMAKEYSRFQRKYQAVLADATVAGMGEGGNIAITKPLSVLSSNGELPPQVVFTMMLGINNWVHQNPTNIVFRSPYDKQRFLYGNHAKNLSDNESKQLRDVGHSYVTAHSLIGNDIASILNISAMDEKSAAYFDNLVPALGMMALRIEHGPSTWDKQRKKGQKGQPEQTLDKDPALTFEEDAAKFRLEVKEWDFKEAVAEDRLFNNATTKAEINELIKEGRAEYNEDGKLISTDTGELVEVTITDYRHIRINLRRDSNGKEIPAKFSDAEVDAKKEMLEVVGADIETEAHKPRQKPKGTVVEFIKNSLGGVPVKVASVLRQLQNVSWTAAETMDIAAKLDQAGFRETMYKLAGKQAVDENDHEAIQESVNSSNDDKINALDDLLLAYDNNGEKNSLKEFYFEYQLQNQHRILMQGQINPQQSHVSRYFVRSWKSVRYKEKNLWKFKLAVAGNLGFKVDKNDLGAALEAFDTMINDPDILSAVNAIQRIDEGGQATELAELIGKIQSRDEYKSVDMSLLNGLTGLSKALNPDGTLKESFNSDVALEIDGISNGFAQNVLQFPMFGEEITEKRLNQTATYIGVTTADTTHITPPDQPDSYQDLGGMVRKHSGIVVDKDGEPTGEPTEESIDTAYEYSRTYKKKFTRQQYISRVKALFNLYPALTNGDFRELVKYPFMIFMYGGGISRISKDVAKDILKEMYVKLNMHQKKYNSLKTAKGKADYMKKDIMPFLNDLTAVGAISKPHEFAKKMTDPEIGSQKEYFNETAFLSRVGDTIAPRLDAGLMEMLGETKEARDAAVQAAELLHAVFITHYDKAYKEAITLRDKNGEKIGERPPLTEREIDKLVKEQLIELLPQYKGPLMQTDQSFIDLTKRQKKDDISNAERIQNVFTNQDGGISHDTGSPRVTTFVAPGVSALIRMIINMDSAILTKTLERHPKLLMLHDAVMGDPETLAEAEKTYGRFYVEFNQEYSVLNTITKQVHKVLNKTRDMDAKNNTNLMGAIDTWIRGKAFVNKNAKGEDVKNTDDLVKHVDSVNNTVKEARAALKQRISERGGIVSHQLYMAKKSIFEGVEEFVRGRTGTRTLINRLIDSMLEAVPKEEREKPPTYKDQERIGKEYREKVKEKDEDTKRLNKARARKEYRKRGKEPPSWTTSGLTKEQIEEDDKFEKDFSDGKYGSLDLDLLQRDNPDPIKEFTGDITEDNIMELFSSFTGFSAKYYNSDAEMAEHTGVLNKILTILAKGMDSTKSIHLTAEDVDGITQGQYDTFSDKIRLSMSRKPPLAANAQSPQEVYVHEMVHAIVSHVLSKNPLLKRRIEKLYRQVRKELKAGEGYEVFLRSIPGGVKNASKQDKEFARAKYAYIFENIEGEAHRLDEFLAYAVADRDFVNYLSSTKSKIHLKFKEDASVFGKAIEVFQYFMEVIVDTLVRALGKRGGFGANANAEMIAVIGELITIQGKHKTKLQLLRDKTYSYLDASDQAIRTFAEEQSYKLVHSEKGNIIQRAYRTAAGTGRIAFSKNADALHIRQAVIERMNYTLRSIAHEVSEGSLSRDLITQLLTSKVRISKARQESERYTIDWFDNIWKSVDLKKDSKSMTIYTREALTNVLFRTDLSSLLNVGLSHREIADLLGDKTKINDTLKEYKRKILKKKAKKFQKIRHALDYADELGEFMATGDTTLEENHMNAYTIAHTILANHTADDVAALDAIATLTALTHLDTREVKNVKELVENEFTASSTDNGFIDLLDSHSEYNQRSKLDLFEDNSAQMMKGYIIERVDDLTGIRTGLLEQTAEMKKEGYTEDPILLGPIPGLKPGDKTHNALFAGRYVPAIPYVSAVMSTTNKRNMGTTITEILSENPKYQKSPGVPNMAMINQAIYDISKEQRVQAKTLVKNRELRLRPVRNDKVQTTDYRIIMNHKTRKKILKPDLEIQNVFAHMQSSFIDRKNTIKSDKRTVELLVYEQKELMPESKPRTFIDLLDPENGYIDRYYRLPKEVRMYIDRFAVNGTFMVREDIIDKVFGYQAKDFRNLNFLQSPRMARMKRWAGLVHYILREIVGYGKDRIVIAMPTVVFNNAMSNVYQLTMRKVPITYTIHKLMEGFHEYKQYSDDHEELRKLKNRRDYKKLPDTAEEHSLILALETRIKANRIHRMSEAGLQNLIVEDLNNASMDGLVNKARRYLRMGPLAKHMTGKVPTAAVQVAAHAVFAKTTEPYQLARTIVQLTDFLGRYVMIEHAMEVRGLSFEDAMHEALDAFVLFDEALAPALEAVDAVGATSFLSYFLRNQRASRQLAMQNPTGVALSGAFQYTTGIQSLGNVNASFLNGDIQPNLMQLDDLFDEADNLTGVDLLRDFWHAMFG